MNSKAAVVEQDVDINCVGSEAEITLNPFEDTNPFKSGSGSEPTNPFDTRENCEKSNPFTTTTSEEPEGRGIMLAQRFYNSCSLHKVLTIPLVMSSPRRASKVARRMIPF